MNESKRVTEKNRCEEDFVGRVERKTQPNTFRRFVQDKREVMINLEEDITPLQVTIPHRWLIKITESQRQLGGGVLEIVALEGVDKRYSLTHCLGVI